MGGVKGTGNGRGGDANLCIANDAVPVFYCYVVAISYVVVKRFLKRLTNEAKGSGICMGGVTSC